MSKLTLWEALSQYKINIPIIQRDYAQGRKGDRQIEQIRKGFIRNLLEHLFSQTPLELDFVYGALHHGQLQLLDGQQRLTTLFLLHWYIAHQTGEQLQYTDTKAQFGQFGYQTRISSKQFMNQLIEQGHALHCTPEQTLSHIIQNEAWYFAAWHHDPTVQSMLTMLDEIHDQYKALSSQSGIDANKLWHNLTQGSVLGFYLLSMEDFALSDELYIKMNARGVQLTEFENFKAWLQGHLEKELDPVLLHHFFNQLDREWTDYIWSFKKMHDNNKDSNLDFDAMFMQLFKSCLLCENHAKEKLNNKNSEKINNNDEKSLVSRLRKNLLITTDEVAALLDSKEAQQQLIDTVSLFFGFAIKHCQHEGVNTILYHIFQSRSSPYDAQANFAILYFYSKYMNLEEQFEDWLSISRRLVNNAKNYYNAEKDLMHVLNAVHELAKYIGKDNVLQKMHALGSESDIFKQLKSAFHQTSIQHEIEKAGLILNDAAWKPLLATYENHAYFYGEIDFLIRFSKDEQQVASKQQFEQLAKIAARLFTDDFLQDKTYILQRALLSLGDYLVPDGSNRSFCQPGFNNVRRRNENWRKLFERKVSEHEQDLLKNLLKQLPPDFNKTHLQDIITQREIEVKDWRSYFIRYPAAIAYCQRYQIRFINTDTIYLLSRKQMNGAHAELRTYVLYLMLREKGYEEPMLQYADASNSSEEPALIMNKDKQSRLKVTFKAGKFINEFFILNNNKTTTLSEAALENAEFSQVITLEQELLS